MRVVVAVVVGYGLWTALWLGGNQLFFASAAETVAAGERLEDAGTLAAILGLSVLCSLVAGRSAAAVAGENAKRAVLVTAILLLATGIGVQLGSWELLPVWYHLSFLTLLVPVAWVAGTFGR